MTDLQLALLATGVAVVVGVIAYNRWQESGVKRRTEDAFAPRHGRGPADALLDNAAAAADTGRARETPAASAHIDRAIDHTLVAEDTPPPAPRDAAAEALGDAGLDAAVDYIVELDCARPVTGAELVRHAQALLDEGLINRVHWEGYDESRALWRPVGPDSRYLRLRVGVQLTSRAGPLSEDDLVAFGAEVQELALAIAAQADFPDLAEAAARAQDLDRFCTAVDVQIGLSVIGSESHAFPGTKVRVLAESAGMAIGRDGRFHRHAEDGSELFSLANLEPMPFHAATIKTLQTRGVTALFDIPRVAASASAFRRFIDFAHQLEHSLGGVLVDDNRKPIGQAALEAIGQQLEHIHRTMAARGIPAGGPLALRLFA